MHGRTALALLFFAVMWVPVQAAEGPSGSKDDTSRLRPLVVMKQAKIMGRVFFIQDDSTDTVADDLRIQVLTYDAGKLLQETRTDKTGRYVLKDLDVGRYRLMVGRLRVTLKVEEASTTVLGRKVPKVILVFIPQELGRQAKN